MNRIMTHKVANVTFLTENPVLHTSVACEAFRRQRRKKRIKSEIQTSSRPPSESCNLENHHNFELVFVSLQRFFGWNGASMNARKGEPSKFAKLNLTKLVISLDEERSIDSCDQPGARLDQT